MCMLSPNGSIHTTDIPPQSFYNTFKQKQSQNIQPRRAFTKEIFTEINLIHTWVHRALCNSDIPPLGGWKKLRFSSAFSRQNTLKRLKEAQHTFPSLNGG